MSPTLPLSRSASRFRWVDDGDELRLLIRRTPTVPEVAVAIGIVTVVGVLWWSGAARFIPLPAPIPALVSDLVMATALTLITAAALMAFTRTADLRVRADGVVHIRVRRLGIPMPSVTTVPLVDGAALVAIDDVQRTALADHDLPPGNRGRSGEDARLVMQREDGSSVELVRGHRRHLLALAACAVRDWLDRVHGPTLSIEDPNLRPPPARPSASSAPTLMGDTLTVGPADQSARPPWRARSIAMTGMLLGVAFAATVVFLVAVGRMNPPGPAVTRHLTRGAFIAVPLVIAAVSAYQLLTTWLLPARGRTTFTCSPDGRQLEITTRVRGALLRRRRRIPIDQLIEIRAGEAMHANGHTMYELQFWSLDRFDHALVSHDLPTVRTTAATLRACLDIPAAAEWREVSLRG